MYTDQDYKDMLGEVWNTLEDLGISFSIEHAPGVGWSFSTADRSIQWYDSYAELESDAIRYTLSQLSSKFGSNTKDAFLNPDK